MEYKISIIIPVFNVEKYIKEALESIIRQTIGLENLEVIMVNDCSTDKSGEIMDEYDSIYDNFIAVHLPENSGAAGKPRNVGIEKATGEYLMFLDPDDYYVDNACETLYDKIVREEVDIVFGRYHYVINDNKTDKKSFSPFGDQNEIKLDSVKEDTRLFTVAPSIWTKIVKRNFIQDNKITFPEGIPGQDAIFVVHTFLKAHGIIYLNNYFPSNYRIRDLDGDTSISRSKSKKNLVGMAKAYYNIFDILKDNKKEEYFPVIFSGNLQFWTENFILSDAKHHEKREILENAGPLFEEFKKYGTCPDKKYLIYLFNCIADKEYDKAILIAEIFSDFIKKQKQLENKLDTRKKQVSELQTTSGWFKYKTRNIYYRLKLKFNK